MIRFTEHEHEEERHEHEHRNELRGDQPATSPRSQPRGTRVVRVEAREPRRLASRMMIRTTATIKPSPQTEGPAPCSVVGGNPHRGAC